MAFVKGIVDEFARRGVEEEIARGCMTYEESDFEVEEEDKEHEDQGLPSTS